ncbi:hypothetical protein EDEG_01781 [Edhazardia aedis USNM 41457]|uniref:Lecithin:cholesterol acyltransferase n=1 Tax=Edhazardia aedis (strain USNM 41457) TaxID=1003232 RepID=J9DMY2_EDHAE|nr:hypothetical protein EDEG_01781 [Edhazardia aedis USNM 41457]|eukprot:EJW03925.1 hypothetical protein EDEG_01781 [Edhazardia aedis USNM 41457]
MNVESVLSNNNVGPAFQVSVLRRSVFTFFSVLSIVIINNLQTRNTEFTDNVLKLLKIAAEESEMPLPAFKLLAEELLTSQMRENVVCSCGFKSAEEMVNKIEDALEDKETLQHVRLNIDVDREGNATPMYSKLPRSDLRDESGSEAFEYKLFETENKVKAKKKTDKNEEVKEKKVCEKCAASHMQKKDERKYKPKNPVIIIPGVSSINLELWNNKEEKNFEFRQDVWGSFGMILNILNNKRKWIKLLLLDDETGLDPQGYKVRPANGFSSSDYIFPGYWVWQKMLHNLGIIGYDHSTLHVASYDWRLSLDNLEIRDKYFSRLKLDIEMYYKLNDNKKVNILSHSLGSICFLYFMSFVRKSSKAFATNTF